MKRIILSLTMIVAVGAIVIASTGAFFNDTETSTGNKFTAGAIDLLVDSEAHYNGFVCRDAGDGYGYVWTDEDGIPGNETPTPLVFEGEECDGSWEETDLNTGEQGPTYKFFDYGDLKPGDSGENTISLHVKNNDAYMCAIIDNMVDLDNSSTEPELEVGDTVYTLDNTGELSKELHFFAWADNYSNGEIEACDNMWQSGEEPKLFGNESGPASDVLGGKVYPMYTPSATNGIGALAGDSKTCIGLYWCYGTISTTNGVLSCDGSLVDNMSQTDSMSADITFAVEQARNNENFSCDKYKVVEKIQE